jgi:hypothetical protein
LAPWANEFSRVALVRRALRFLVAGAAAFSIAVAPLACGSEDEDKTVPGAEVRPPRLPPVDKRAYRRIQQSSGDLRAAAIAVSYGSSEVVVADQLRADIRKLENLDPHDPLLKRLHRRALRALRSAGSAGQGAAAQAAAAAAIAEADRIDAGLRRYAASHPAANELTPG